MYNNMPRGYGKPKFTLDPDYYYNKYIHSNKKRMDIQQPISVLEAQPVIKEKKKPGRKKKVVPPKNPISVSDKGVTITFS